MLKIAVQKKGRLHDDSLHLLKNCGISVENGRDQLKVKAKNFPLELFYLRNSDIPKYIEDGVVDVGIIGENLIVEKQKEMEIIQRLGFSKCRVSLAIPKNEAYHSIRDFSGKRIATSYPNTLQSFLDEHQLEASIHTIAGSVEIAPNIGLADGICDIVSSGNTLFKNGLKEVAVLFQSEAVLAKSLKISEESAAILDKLIFRMQAVLSAKRSKYVLMNVPNDKIEEVGKILPVLKSPTVVPLAETGWSSLHSVINENEFWEVIDALKAAGAEGILVIPIEKMIF